MVWVVTVEGLSKEKGVKEIGSRIGLNCKGVCTWLIDWITVIGGC